MLPHNSTVGRVSIAQVRAPKVLNHGVVPGNDGRERDSTLWPSKSHVSSPVMQVPMAYFKHIAVGIMLVFPMHIVT